MTTTHETEPEQGTALAAEAGERHPALECRTCLAEVSLIDPTDVPRSNVCLGPTGNPRACNTEGLRHRAGLDKP